MNKRKISSSLGFELLGFVAISILIAIFSYFVLFYGSIAVAEHSAANFNYSDFLLNSLSDTDVIEYNILIGRIRLLCLSASFILWVFSFLLMIRSKVNYIYNISQTVSLFQSGRETQRIAIKGTDELSELAASINQMADRIVSNQLAEKEMRGENQNLIIGLAHDIRTPLTSVMSYLEFIKDGKYTNDEQMHHYITTAYEKAVQIKFLTGELFDYCKDSAATGCAPEAEVINAKLLFSQLLYEACDYLGELGYKTTVKNTIPTTANIKINADIMRRVFDNIISNLLKYADVKSPISFCAETKNNLLVLRQTNTIGKNPSTQSSGVGLKSGNSLLMMYGGRLDTKEESNCFFLEITLKLS